MGAVYSKKQHYPERISPCTKEKVTQPGIPKERTERDGSPRKINYVR